MRVLVTGADGFVGRALVAALSRDADSGSEIIATDRRFAALSHHARVLQVALDLADQASIAGLCGPGFDLVFHLASQPGSAAERSPDGGRSINRDATLDLIDAVARSRGEIAPRFVFASSIAVYGGFAGQEASEDAVARPALSYGAHKLIGEIELADRTRRGEALGVSLRLPGIVARPPEESGHGSAFMSRIFHAARGGETYVCPVSRDARCWWMSIDCVVDNLMAAARLDAALVRSRPAWQLPVLAASVGEVIDALANRLGKHAVDAIRFEPDPAIEALFGAMPTLSAPSAQAAGFRHDGTVDDLVRRVLAGFGAE